jgi:uncharacterized membrane protein YhdT
VSPVEQPAPPGRIRARWTQLRNWWRRTWINIRPGPEARKGAAWAVIAAAVWAAIVGGIYLESGFSRWIDFPFAFAVAAIGIPLVAVLVAFLLTILRKLPRLATGFIVGGCIFIALAFGPIGPAFAAVVTLIECILGATIATFLFGHFRAAAVSKKIITITLFAASLAGNVWLYMFLSREGEMGDILRLQQTASPVPAQLTAPRRSRPIRGQVPHLRKRNRYSPPRIRKISSNQNHNGRRLAVLQGFHGMESQSSETILGFRHGQTATQRPCLVSRWPRPLPPRPDRSRQPQHGRLLRSRLSVPGRIARKPRLHPGFD